MHTYIYIHAYTRALSHISKYYNTDFHDFLIIKSTQYKYSTHTHKSILPCSTIYNSQVLEAT